MNDTNPSGTILGHGSFRYRLDTSWCRADPAEFPVNNCHEMAQASDGRLFLITDDPRNNILIYDTGGNVLDAWTLGWEGAHGLTLHEENGTEFLYLTGTETGQVAKTTLDGEIVLGLSHPHDSGAYRRPQRYRPTETAVAPNGDIYVADGYGSQYILRFDREGRFISKFGGKSAVADDEGKFLQVHGVAIDTRSGTPELVASARIRNELQWFDLEGNFLRRVYLPGAYISRPVIRGSELYAGVCFGTYENDYRMWSDRGFVVILDGQNRVVSCPGGREPHYGPSGKLEPLIQQDPVFKHCHDVCVDQQGDLYVCQWNAGRARPYKLHRV